VSRARLAVAEPVLFECKLLEMAAPIQSPTKRDVRSVIRFLKAVTVTLIQDCGEKPMFHLQSQWNPEIYLLPVRSA
jgi:hypothetical protein